MSGGNGAFAGRVALVTGATRGLGRSIARKLGAGGTEVIALARTAGGLEELDDEIKRAGGPGATLVPLDVTDDAGLERLGLAIHQRWGRLDLWVHCAAHATPLSPVEHIADKDLDRAMAVNGRATQRLIRVVHPLLRAAPLGVAVVPLDRENAGAFHASYEASKAAQEVYVRAWAAETAKFNIAVLRPQPPVMGTALRARFRPGEAREAMPHPDAAADAILAEISAAFGG